MESDMEFSVEISQEDLYKYNLHHAYTSGQGIFSILVAALLIVAWVMQLDKLSTMYIVLYPVIAILFLVYLPLNLKLRVKNQMTQEVFRHPLDYKLKKEGLLVSSVAAEEPALLPWDYVYKIVTWKGYLLIYSSRVNAYIIPKNQLGDKYEGIVAFIRENVEDYKLTIR